MDSQPDEGMRSGQRISAVSGGSGSAEAAGFSVGSLPVVVTAYGHGSVPEAAEI
jgi:hypothetical protein